MTMIQKRMKRMLQEVLCYWRKDEDEWHVVRVA